MNREAMQSMSPKELDSYGALLKIDMSKAKGRAQKIDLIERSRERRAEVTVLGIDFEIPMKRLSDKRVSDLLSKASLSDDEALEVLGLVLGEEQLGRLVDACTEDDGTVDAVAIGYAFASIMTSDELKN